MAEEFFVLQATVDTNRAELSATRAKILNELSGIVADINFRIPNASLVVSSTKQIRDNMQGAATGTAMTAREMRDLRVSTKQAAIDATKLADAAAKTETFFAGVGKRIGSFLRFSIASFIVTQLTRPLIDATKAVIDLNDIQVKFQQITGRSAYDVKQLTTQIFDLGKTLGINSSELIKSNLVLAQAGFQLNEIKKITAIIGKTDLTPSFESLEKTSEGLISVLNQFDLNNNVFGAANKFLDITNAVSKAFAVESGNIIEAVRNAGGVFAVAEGLIEGAGTSIDKNIDSFKEFVALFTSIRATTRLSSNVISTGFRTIIQRSQQIGTETKLKKILGDDFSLRDTEGQFIGVAEAFQKVGDSIREAGFKQTSLQVQQIVEALAGIRQSKIVIPLLFDEDGGRQKSIYNRVLDVANASEGSVSEDAELRQESLKIKVEKLKKEFFALFIALSENDGLKVFIDQAFILTRALSGLIKTLETLGPLILGLAALKTAQFIVPKILSLESQERFGVGAFGVDRFSGRKRSVGNSSNIRTGIESGYTEQLRERYRQEGRYTGTGPRPQRAVGAFTSLFGGTEADKHRTRGGGNGVFQSLFGTPDHVKRTQAASYEYAKNERGRIDFARNQGLIPANRLRQQAGEDVFTAFHSIPFFKNAEEERKKRLLKEAGRIENSVNFKHKLDSGALNKDVQEATKIPARARAEYIKKALGINALESAFGTPSAIKEQVRTQKNKARENLNTAEERRNEQIDRAKKIEQNVAASKQKRTAGGPLFKDKSGNLFYDSAGTQLVPEKDAKTYRQAKQKETKSALRARDIRKKADEEFQREETKILKDRIEAGGLPERSRREARQRIFGLRQNANRIGAIGSGFSRLGGAAINPIVGGYKRAFGIEGGLSAEDIDSQAKLISDPLEADKFRKTENKKLEDRINKNNRARNRRFIAGTGAFLAGQYLANNQDAFGSGERARRGTAVAGGALSGATTGFALAGPLGGAIGAVAGFTKSLQDFNKSEALSKIGTKLNLLRQEGFKDAQTDTLFRPPRKNFQNYANGGFTDIKNQVLGRKGGLATGNIDKLIEQRRKSANQYLETTKPSSILNTLSFGAVSAGKRLDTSGTLDTIGEDDAKYRAYGKQIYSETSQEDEQFLAETQGAYDRDVGRIKKAGFNSVEEFVKQRPEESRELRNNFVERSRLRIKDNLSPGYRKFYQSEEETEFGFQIAARNDPEVARQIAREVADKKTLEAIDRDIKAGQDKFGDKLLSDYELKELGRQRRVVEYKGQYEEQQALTAKGTPKVFRDLNSEVKASNIVDRQTAVTAIRENEFNRALGLAENAGTSNLNPLYDDRAEVQFANLRGLKPDEFGALQKQPGLGDFFKTDAGQEVNAGYLINQKSQELSKTLLGPNVDLGDFRTKQQFYQAKLEEFAKDKGIQDTDVFSQVNQSAGQYIDDASSIDEFDRALGLNQFGRLAVGSDPFKAGEEQARSGFDFNRARAERVGTYSDRVTQARASYRDASLGFDNRNTSLQNAANRFLSPEKGPFTGFLGNTEAQDLRADRLLALGTGPVFDSNIVSEKREKAVENLRNLEAGGDIINTGTDQEKKDYALALTDARTEIDNLTEASRILAEDTADFDAILLRANKSLEEFGRGATTSKNIFEAFQGKGSAGAADTQKDLQEGIGLLAKLRDGTLTQQEYLDPDKTRQLNLARSTFAFDEADNAAITQGERNLVNQYGGGKFVDQAQQAGFGSARIVAPGESEKTERDKYIEEIKAEQDRLKEAGQNYLKIQGEQLTALEGTITTLVTGLSEANIAFALTKPGVDAMAVSLNLFSTAVGVLAGSKLQVEGSLQLALSFEDNFNQRIQQAIGSELERRLGSINEGIESIKLQIRDT